ncbi:MAG: OadG family protein [Candidatus Cryptobacteroides sp.]
MIDYLTFLLSTSAKSEMLAQRDPHGFIMTITAVAVVFGALIILYFFFGILGNFFSGRINLGRIFRRRKGKGKEDEIAAAIAMALNDELSGEVHAAIGLALNEYLDDTVHDYESYIITIKRK